MNTLQRKMKLNQYFQNGPAIIDLMFLQNVPMTRPLYRHSRQCFGGQKFIKIRQNVYEGLTFSHVKFYYNLSAGFENLPRKPQNFVDNLPLASMSFIFL